MSSNISELRHAGYPEKQAVAIAYSKARGDGEPATLDSLFQAADALYARSDALEQGKWAEQCEKDAQITSGNYSNAKPGDKITQEWNGKSWKTVDPKSPAKGPRQTQTWTGSRWDSTEDVSQRMDAADEAIEGCADDADTRVDSANYWVNLVLQSKPDGAFLNKTFKVSASSKAEAKSKAEALVDKNKFWLSHSEGVGLADAADEAIEGCADAADHIKIVHKPNKRNLKWEVVNTATGKTLDEVGSEKEAQRLKDKFDRFWEASHRNDADNKESEQTKARHEGKLSKSEREGIGTVGSSKREDMPRSVFLKPSARKYPVKEKKGDTWVYDRELLLAAARRARMEGDDDLAREADAIRQREFGSAKADGLTVCPTCTYPHEGKHCTNPGCTANPSVSASQKARWAEERSKREAEEAERKRIRDIRSRFSYGRKDASSPQPGDQVTISKSAFERLRAGGYSGPRVARVKSYSGGDLMLTNGQRVKPADVTL